MDSGLTKIQEIARQSILSANQPRQQTQGCFNCKHHQSCAKVEEVKNSSIRHIKVTAGGKIECYSSKRAEYLKKKPPFIQKWNYKCQFWKLFIQEIK